MRQIQEMLLYASRFRRLYQKSFQGLGEALGLSQLEMDMLLFLYNNPERNTARDAVALRGFAKSNVSTAVEALERKDWLEVTADPDSRRVKRLVLRRERAEELEVLSACQERCWAAVLDGFAPEELEGLRALTQRMDDNIRRALEELEGEGK